MASIPVHAEATGAQVGQAVKKQPVSDAVSLPAPRFLPPDVEQDRFDEFAKRVLALVGQDNLEIISADTPLVNNDMGKTAYKYDAYRSADNEVSYSPHPPSPTSQGDKRCIAPGS